MFPRSAAEGNIDILNDVIYFALLPTKRLLAGNSFIVRCHVTSRRPLRARASAGKTQPYNKSAYFTMTTGMTQA